MNDELNHINSIIEKVLLEKYPNFPKDLVFAVLQTQAESLSEPVEAQKKICALIMNYLKEHGDVTF